MLKIPQEKVDERWDSLPESLRVVLFSTENSDIIRKACLSRGITEEKIAVVGVLVGDVIMGFLSASDLAAEISKDLGIDQNAAAEISSEIDSRVFTPIREEMERVYHSSLRTAPVDASHEPQRPPEKLKPAFAPGSPFILHAEEEVKPAAESGAVKPTLKRPSFYKPAFSQYASPAAKPEAARLELGVEATKTGEPKTIKVGEEGARVVHYSDMRTPLDPFSKIPANNKVLKEHKPEKKDVHPDNVVNLKDLPL